MLRTTAASARARAGLLALALIGILATTGCGSGSSTTSETTAGSASPTNGGTLRYAMESSPATLDPSRAIEASAITAILQFSEGLFEIDEAGKPVPNLATRVETSKDGLKWTLQLRKGIEFSDGKPMTSKDVAFTIDQARNNPINASLFEPITRVSAPSPSTVVLEVKSHFPALPSLLACYCASVVPKNYAGMSEKAFAEAPVGTGPYMVTSAGKGGAIQMVPNSHYWKPDKPHFSEVVFTVATDENSRLQQIRGGELDMTRATPLTAKTGVPAGSGIRVETTGQNIGNYLMLNEHKPIFENKKVREAVNLVVDREGIIKAATDGKGQLGSSFLPPSVTFAIDSKPPARNVTKAKQLIAEATKEGTETSASFTINYYNFDAYSGVATQIVQQNLAEIGLHAKLESLDEAALNELIPTGEYDAILGLYQPAAADPEGFTGFYLEFFAAGAGQDVEALTKLADEAAVELDEAKRAELYGEIQEMVAKEQSLLMLNYQPAVYPTVEKTTGLEFDPFGYVLLRNAGFSE